MIDQADRLRDIIKQRMEEESVFLRSNINARLITVTSGKGGVGKTNFTVNLAIQLRKRNKRVVIIDADFGLANIEVLFGILPKYSFADLIAGVRSIEEILTNGPMDIKFISGGSGLSDMANMNYKQMTYIISNFAHLDALADIILIDTGAGISRIVVDFIRASSEAILITTPEPTSVTDAYAIIKSVKSGNEDLPLFKLVVNRVDSQTEGLEIFDKLNKVSDRFLNVQLENLGYIPNDQNVVKAIKKQEPVSLCYPNSDVTLAIEKICSKLLNDEPVNETTQRGMLTFAKKLVNFFSRSK